MSQASAVSGMRSSRLWSIAMRGLRPLGPWLPASIYSHLWSIGPFTVRIAGARFRIQHGGAELENQLFWRNMFESERGTALIAARLAHDASGFLDVGANSGFFSLLAKSLAPRIPVIAIEASAANFDLLETNVRLNGFDVRTVAAAATARDGEVVFHDFDGPSYSASIEALIRQASKPAGGQAPSSGACAA